MATLGRRNILTVSRMAEAGAYVDAGALGEVLLPRRYVTAAMRAGAAVDVFLHRDSEDRLVATTERPLAMVGEFACMEVRDVNPRAGAFLGWGLPKDLLLPFREQGKPVKVGQKVQVFVVEVDLERKRIALSMKANPTSAPRENRTSPVAPRPPGGGPRPGGSSVGRPQGGQRPPARGWENAGGLSALADAFDKAKPKP